MAHQTINPIIPGFSPDPSIVHVDGVYFLVTSTFHMFPGLPIYTSTDLVHWRQIGNAINRQSQLSLKRSDTKIKDPDEKGEVMLATLGLFAPTIRHHKGTFYITCTNVIHRHNAQGLSQNFIICTTDILKSEWSDPVYFDFHGIDPSLFFDDDGKVYLHGSGSPGPTIHLFEIDVQTGEKRSEQKSIWAGTGGIYPEGPHIYKLRGYYYLMISEGGTHEGHMITLARSKNVWGPYEVYPGNPILTAAGTEEYVQFTGHCDLFEDREGDWWGVCLGVRMDEGNRYIMGRETFLTRTKWDDEGWLRFERVKIEMEMKGVEIADEKNKLTAAPHVGFLYIRDAGLSRYKWSNDGPALTLTASPVDLSHPEESPTFVGERQRCLVGTSRTTISSPANLPPHMKTGIAVYKDEHRYFRVFYDIPGRAIVLEVTNNAKKISRRKQQIVPLGDGDDLRIRLEYTEKEYMVVYSTAFEQHKYLDTVDTLELTDPDFVGPIIGIFAVGGEGVEVEFKDFVVF